MCAFQGGGAPPLQVFTAFVRVRDGTAVTSSRVLLEFSGSEMRVFPDSGIALATWGQFTADSEGFPIGSSEDMVFAEKLDQFYMQSDLQFCL